MDLLEKKTKNDIACEPVKPDRAAIRVPGEKTTLMMFRPCCS